VPVGREVVPDQSEVRLMDEGGRLEGLARPLPGEQVGGQSAELGVHEREQGGGGLRVAGGRRVQELCNICYFVIIYRAIPDGNGEPRERNGRVS
jgi:hypothetical protein